MSTTITADAETLLRQATITASQYFHEAIAAIDKKFGDGFAVKHPELVSAFMHASAQDFDTAIKSQTMQDGFGQIAGAILSQKG